MSKKNKKQKDKNFYPIKIIIKICDQEKKRVGGDLFSVEIFSPPLSSLSLLCLNLLSHVFPCRKAFYPYCLSYLLTTRVPEFHQTGVTSWPAGSQDKRWQKGRRAPTRTPRRAPRRALRSVKTYNTLSSYSTILNYCYTFIQYYMLWYYSFLLVYNWKVSIIPFSCFTCRPSCRLITSYLLSSPTPTYSGHTIS